jgi:hypothetical protein
MPGDVLAAEFYDQRPTADVVRIPPIDPGPDQWKPDHRRPWVPMMRSPVVASTVPGLKAVLQGWPRRTNLTSWRDTLPGRYRATVYGDEIKDNLADLPEPFDEALPRFLTEFGFGDFYTRTGLTLAERELLVLCALATIGDTSPQLGPTAVRASRWATPRLPSSQHWCTASPTPGSLAPSLPYARSRTFSTNTAVLLVNLLDDLAADQPTPVDCAGQPGGATHRSCACQAHLIRQRSVVQVHLGPPTMQRISGVCRPRWVRTDCRRRRP